MIRRLELRVSESPAPWGRAIIGPADLAEYARECLADASCDVEVFLVVPLDNRHRPLGFRRFDGHESGAVVSPSAVLRTVLLAGCSHFMVLHTHPSGDSAPSGDDVRTTARLREAARTIDMELVDHVVLGDGYTSIREHNPHIWREAA